MKNLVNFYFHQTESYLSESRGEAVVIASMHPTYAANAARRLIVDGHHWAEEAGVPARDFARWVMGTPLWNALHRRSQGILPFMQVTAETWK